MEKNNGLVENFESFLDLLKLEHRMVYLTDIVVHITICEYELSWECLLAFVF